MSGFSIIQKIELSIVFGSKNRWTVPNTNPASYTELAGTGAFGGRFTQFTYQLLTVGLGAPA